MIVVIPTYARPRCLQALLESLQRELPDAAVLVGDDASPEPYAREVCAASGLACHVVRADKRHGRTHFGRWIHTLLTHDLVTRAGAVVPVMLLADDMPLVPGAGERVFEHLAVAEAHEGCLGVVMHTDQRSSCWGLHAQPLDEAGERVAWQDGAWCVPAYLVPTMLPSPRPNPRLPGHAGTGVWRHVSLRVSKAGGWWYRPRRSLTHHDDQGTSVLNPWWNGRPRAVETAW